MEDNCPYCFKEVEIVHDDGYGYEEGRLHQQECGKCGKTFVYETSIIIYHYTAKADCLNGGTHDFQPTVTYPKEYTEMQCLSCGEIRKPTAEEKVLHHIPEIYL